MNRAVGSKISALLVVAVCIIPMVSCSSGRMTEVLPVKPEPTDRKNAKASSIPEPGKKSDPDIFSRLYEKSSRLLSPPWNSPEKISQMVSAIRNASADGLDPKDYHLMEIESLSEKIAFNNKTNQEDVDRLEFLLTDAFTKLSSGLFQGRTDPLRINPEWEVERKTISRDWKNYSDSVLLMDNVTSALRNLAPANRDYNNLKEGLKIYLNIADSSGWGVFKKHLLKLDTGIRHPDVVLLRKRLEIIQGPISFTPGNEELFDDTLKNHVILFQRMNGLDPDGVVGKATVEALNIPAEERVKTIEANLERWRWLNGILPDKYILVNIPGFSLKLIERDTVRLESLAIVGRYVRQTPVFSAKMKYIVINPDWSIPDPIMADEILPNVIKDRSYLEKNDMEIFKPDGTVVNPASIDWSNITSNGFPYMIKQEPGEKNPLGHIKFMFPNHFNVYIHDTPSRYLFSQSTRAFSHGCVRINEAHELANYLLGENPDWNPEDLQKAIDDGKERIIVLKNPVPVFILYFTAWADDNGRVCFARDIYGRDQSVISALGNGN